MLCAMPSNHSIVYSLASWIALPPYVLTVKTIIEGEHFVPREGPVILVSNHISFIDPLSLGYLGRRRHRQIHFLAKDGLFNNRIFGAFLRACGQIPVARGTQKASESLNSARQSLKKGHVVGIYPEATMPDDLVQLPIKSGALRLAQETGAPIVVVGTWGAHEVWRKGYRPRLRFRHRHAMVVLPSYIVNPDADIETARVDLADKMKKATQQAQQLKGMRR